MGRTSLKVSHEERRSIYVKQDNRKRCELNHKICYRTKKRAVKAMNQANAQGFKKGLKQLNSVYKCPACAEWHTTKLFQDD